MRDVPLFYSNDCYEKLPLTPNLNLSTSQPLNLSTSQPLNSSTTQPLNLNLNLNLNPTAKHTLPQRHRPAK
jgi:hypothetical protein